MIKKEFLFSAIAVMSLSLSGCDGLTSNLSRKDALSTAQIPTAEVQRGNLERVVSSIGELKAARSSILSPAFSGQVTEMVDEGSRVAPGDPVIWLDTQEILEQIEERKALILLSQKDLESAREEYRLQEIQNGYNLQSELARVELAEQQLEDRRQKYATEKILVEKNISARSRLEEAELATLQAAVSLRNANINLKKVEENLSSNLRQKQTGIDRALLEIERDEKRLEELEDRLENAILRAPVAGEVSYMRIWRSGSLAKLAVGDSVWDRLNLAEIPDRSEMLAIIPVNELDVATIEVNQPATVRLDAVPGETFAAVVQKKSIMPIESTSGTGGPREFEVSVLITLQDDRFFQGMTAAVDIQVAYEGEALLVPLEALSLNDENQIGIWSAENDAFIPVEVNLINDRFASVEGNVKEGDQVYLRAPGVPSDEGRELMFDALQRVQQKLRDTAGENGARIQGAHSEEAPRVGG